MNNVAKTLLAKKFVNSINDILEMAEKSPIDFQIGLRNEGVSISHGKWEKEIPPEKMEDPEEVAGLMMEAATAVASIEFFEEGEVVESSYDYSHVAGEKFKEHEFPGNDFVLEKVDARLIIVNDQALDLFWNVGGKDCLKENLNSLIGDAPINVYHRKGKDWYVALNPVFLDDIGVPYLEEVEDGVFKVSYDYYELSEMCICPPRNKLDQTVKKVVDAIKKSVDNVNLEGFVCMACEAIEEDQKADFPLLTFKEPLDEDSLKDWVWDYAISFYSQGVDESTWRNGFFGRLPDPGNIKEMVEHLRNSPIGCSFSSQNELNAMLSALNASYELEIECTYSSPFEENYKLSLWVKPQKLRHFRITEEDLECSEGSWIEAAKNILYATEEDVEEVFGKTA